MLDALAPLALASLLAAAPAAFTPDGNLERAQVPDEFKWKLAPLFADDVAFEAGLKQAVSMRRELAGCKGQLAAPEKLASCLQLYFRTRLQTNKLTLYTNLRFETDQKNTALRAMNDRSLKAMNDLMADASFLRQELLALDEAQLKAAYAKVPALREYAPYVEELRRRRSRVLGAEAERVLALANDNLWAEIDLNELPSDFEKLFGAALSDIPWPSITDEAGKPVQLTLSNFPRYRASADRRVRREAVEALLKTLKQYEDVFAASLSGQVNLNIFYARARGYPTALEAYLDKDNIAPAVYRNLISAVRANLAPLHRYVALRKRVLGVDRVHLYDLYVPMVAKAKLQFPFAEARRILPAALAPLGPDYLKVLETGLDPANGWLDLYPNKHKESGAFCSSTFGVHPFVKMNYLDALDDMSTLAHEYGHALHSHLAMTQQPYATSSYVMFLAEIASTVNEKLLSDWLVQNAKSDQERLYVLNKLAESLRTTIYRQTLFAEFELAVHTAAEKGEPLTAEGLKKIYAGLVRDYYGKDFALDAEDGLEWAYVPHFYYKYYVYSYATGLSAAVALAEKIQSGKPEARDAYLKMLGSGCAQPPLTLLKQAGVDLSKPEAVVAAAKLLDATLDRMEKLMAK